MSDTMIFNRWKHHAGWVRGEIRVAIENRTPLDVLHDELAVVGSELMDFFTGELTPETVLVEVAAILRAEKAYERLAFRAMLGKRGYTTRDLSDRSTWVMNFAISGPAHIHVWPGRHSKHSVRVRASTLKTAILARVMAGQRRDDPLDLAVINWVRDRIMRTHGIVSLAESPAITDMIRLLGPQGVTA